MADPNTNTTNVPGKDWNLMAAAQTSVPTIPQGSQAIPPPPNMSGMPGNMPPTMGGLVGGALPPAQSGNVLGPTDPFDIANIVKRFP